MKTPLIIIALLFTAYSIVRAEDYTFYLSKTDTRDISRESMVKGTLQWAEDVGESIVVSVYSTGKKVGELKAADTDLQKLYDAARASEDDGPFFGHVDEYVVSDQKDRWFLIQYEYPRPGSDFHIGRFRVGRLVRIVEGADLFFLVDYMQASGAKDLGSKMAELGELKSVIDRRGQHYRMLLRAAESNKKKKENKSEMATPRKPSD